MSGCACRVLLCFLKYGQQPMTCHKLSSVIGVPRAYVDRYYNELKEKISRSVFVLVYGVRTAFTMLYTLQIF